MEQIKKIEKEIDDLKVKIQETEKLWSLESKIFGDGKYPNQISDLNKKIETREKFIQAIIKNIETNNEYVNQQEVKRETSSQRVFGTGFSGL